MDIVACLFVSSPNNVLVSVTGSGVINDVVSVIHYAWKFTADAGAQGDVASPYDVVQIQVCVSPCFTETSVEINGSLETTSGMGRPSVVPLSEAAICSEDIFFLHNNPTPQMVIRIGRLFRH